MNRERFETLLAAYGADPKRWPAEERAAAKAFNPDLAGEARSIDALLDIAREAPQTNPGLASKIMNAAPRKAARTSFAFDRRAALALAACAVVGVVVGYGSGRLAPVGEDPDAALMTALEMSFEGPWDVTSGGEGG
jgi:hypothetical protein